MQASAPPTGGQIPLYQLEHSTNTQRQYNKFKCTPCRIRKQACEYNVDNHSDTCQLCIQNPHEIPCGPKLQANQDPRWNEWKNNEAFLSEVHQLIRKRLQNGETHDDIRRLLQLPNTTKGHPQPSMNNSDPSPPIASSSDQSILPVEGPLPHFSQGPSSVPYDTGGIAMQYPANPFRFVPFTNNSTTFQPKFALPEPSFEGYSNSGAVGPSDVNFSNVFTVNEDWPPPHAGLQFPIGDNAPSQSQVQPLESQHVNYDEMFPYSGYPGDN